MLNLTYDAVGIVIFHVALRFFCAEGGVLRSSQGENAMSTPTTASRIELMRRNIPGGSNLQEAMFLLSLLLCSSSLRLAALLPIEKDRRQAKILPLILNNTKSAPYFSLPARLVLVSAGRRRLGAGICPYNPRAIFAGIRPVYNELHFNANDDYELHLSTARSARSVPRG